MKKQLTITVPKPCTESWDKMTLNEKGKHCASCNKTVTDFTNYTDKELADFFKKSSGNICGRISNYQANRPILITEQYNRSIFHRLLYGTALASWLGISATASAQNSGKKITRIHNELRTQLKEMKTIDALRPTPETNTGDTTNYIEGKVTTGYEKKPVEFITISIKESPLYTITSSDVAGKFRFEIRQQFIGKPINLVFSAKGYDTRELVVNTDSLPHTKLDVELYKPEYFVMGCMVGCVSVTTYESAESLNVETGLLDHLPAKYEAFGPGHVPAPLVRTFNKMR
jgi:hypothetical protein